MGLTLGSALAAARQRLATTSDTPDLDARLLLEQVLGVDAAHLIVHRDRVLPADAYAAFEALLARRAHGEPVAYLLGRAGFWSLELSVGPDVLVPRPDTETLVAAALARLDAEAKQIADLGTGSGAIALALAQERPRWMMLATDVSADALACARANAKRLGLARVAFACGAWFAPLSGRRFDAIVSNPPYVAEHDPHLAALGHEPRTALTAGDEGLADLAHLIEGAPAHLQPGGWLMLEHGADQGTAVRALFRQAGYHAIETCRDLGERERVTIGRRD